MVTAGLELQKEGSTGILRIEVAIWGHYLLIVASVPVHTGLAGSGKKTAEE